MDYFRLMLKNATRNRRRTLLTVAGMGVSLFLLVSLRTLLSELEFNALLTPESALVLVTRHAVSLTTLLPLAHRQRIAQVPGVELVTPMAFCPGYYQDPTDFLTLGGVDREVVTGILSAWDYKTDPAEIEAYKRDRTGALVPQKLMERFGWKLGDPITIIPRFLPFNVELGNPRHLHRPRSDRRLYPLRLLERADASALAPACRRGQFVLPPRAHRRRRAPGGGGN